MTMITVITRSNETILLKTNREAFQQFGLQGPIAFKTHKFGLVQVIGVGVATPTVTTNSHLYRDQLWFILEKHKGLASFFGNIKDAATFIDEIPEAARYVIINKPAPVPVPEIPKSAPRLSQLCIDYINKNTAEVIYYGVPNLGSEKILIKRPFAVERTSPTQIMCSYSYDYVCLNTQKEISLLQYFEKLQIILEKFRIIELPEKFEEQEQQTIQKNTTSFPGQTLYIALHEEYARQTTTDNATLKFLESAAATITTSRLLQALVQQLYPDYKNYKLPLTNLNVAAKPVVAPALQIVPDLPIAPTPKSPRKSMILKLKIESYYFDPLEIDTSEDALMEFGYLTPLSAQNSLGEERLLIGVSVDPYEQQKKILWFADSPAYLPFGNDYLNNTPFKDFDLPEMIDYTYLENKLGHLIAQELPQPSASLNNTNNTVQEPFFSVPVAAAPRPLSKPVLEPKTLRKQVADYIESNLVAVVESGANHFLEPKVIRSPLISIFSNEPLIESNNNSTTVSSGLIEATVLPTKESKNKTFTLLNRTLQESHLNSNNTTNTFNKKSYSLLDALKNRKEKLVKTKPELDRLSLAELKAVNQQNQEILSFLRAQSATLLSPKESAIVEKEIQKEADKPKRKYTKRKNEISEISNDAKPVNKKSRQKKVEEPTSTVNQLTATTLQK